MSDDTESTNPKKPRERFFGVMPREILVWEQDRFIHFVLHHSDAKYTDEERQEIDRALYIKPRLGESRRLSEINFIPCECEDRVHGYKKEGADKFSERLKMWGVDEFSKKPSP